MKKVLLTTVMSLMMCIGIYAQDYGWKKPPKPTEIEIGIVTRNVSAGGVQIFLDKKGNEKPNSQHDRTRNYSDEELYQYLLNDAQQKYGETYPKFSLRNFKSTCIDCASKEYDRNIYDQRYVYKSKEYRVSASVVVKDAKVEANEYLSQAIDKAFRNVRQGSRIAIDQVTVWSGIDREDYKDQLIDILLDKGYKVVAKEYLEKLFQEQQDQLSGIYNESTTVQENNFSAVGYYINVKVTETSLRVQVVNVSTGEYEGNATVNF